MNILLTGGSGVIGKEFILRMISNHKIIAIGKSFQNFPEFIRQHKNFKFYEFDLTSTENFQIPDRIDTILHLAGIVSDSKKSSLEYREGNILATQKILEIAKLHRVPNFIFASSISVYGNSELELKKETASLSGNSDYAKSKIDAENLVLSYVLDFITIFRIASVFGKNTKGFISKLEKLWRKKILPIPNSSDAKNSFIHIQDLIAYLEIACANKKTGIFNLAYPTGFSFSEIVNTLETKFPQKMIFKIKLNKFISIIVSMLNKILFQLKIVKNQNRLDIRPLNEFIQVDSSKAIKEFSYIPKISIDSNWRDI